MWQSGQSVKLESFGWLLPAGSAQLLPALEPQQELKLKQLTVMTLAERYKVRAHYVPPFCDFPDFLLRFSPQGPRSNHPSVELQCIYNNVAVSYEVSYLWFQGDNVLTCFLWWKLLKKTLFHGSEVCFPYIWRKFNSGTYFTTRKKCFCMPLYPGFKMLNVISSHNIIIVWEICISLSVCVGFAIWLVDATTEHLKCARAGRSAD